MTFNEWAENWNNGLLLEKDDAAKVAYLAAKEAYETGKLSAQAENYVQPTAEAIELAEEAYMPFGDMETALSVAFTAVDFKLAKEVARRGKLLQECLEFLTSESSEITADKHFKLVQKLEGL